MCVLFQAIQPSWDSVCAEGYGFVNSDSQDTKSPTSKISEITLGAFSEPAKRTAFLEFEPSSSEFWSLCI